MNYVKRYNHFSYEQIKKALRHIKLDWDMLTDSGEIEILIKYTYATYIFSIVIYSKIV